MLTELHIENIAVIERADIEPGPGLNVLTGETGAGKSIVIDSLQAVLGGRTSRELVRTGAERATVTAVFTSDGTDGWFDENGLDAEDTVIIRRRIGADGKSSATVNGAPVAAAQLRSLGALLLDIHGQNDGRQLMDETRHREYLDGFGELQTEIAEYAEKYDAWRATKKALESLRMDEAEKLRLTESLRYRVDELTAAALTAGEEERLSSRRELLRNAEKLTEAAEGAYDALYGGDGSALEMAGQAQEQTRRAGAYAPELLETAKLIDSARCELEDAAERLRDFLGALDFSPEEYDALESRLQQLRRLEKKYNTDEAGLIAELERSARRLEEIEFSDERTRELTAKLELDKAAAMKAARALSEKRKTAGDELTRRIEEGLRQLSMPSVRFQVELAPVEGEPGFDRFGCDQVRFLMSANAGETPGRISRIASGGELSRIMLAMKEVLSERDPVQAMVFDEIDEGVSGVAAQRVGEKLARLSGRKQVICVTHLPQIAAMADTHFRILKAERDGRAYTSVTALTREGRIEELARLHGGDNITETTKKSAAEQLDAAVAYKKGAMI